MINSENVHHSLQYKLASPHSLTYSPETAPTYAVLNVPVGPRQVEFCSSPNWVHICSTMYVGLYARHILNHVCRPICKGVQLESKLPNTLEPDRPQYDHPTECVIAQVYSSATFVSQRFQSREEKFGARFKNATF
jgi:hypothetical protein